MAYRKVYFRIRTECYSSGWSSDADRAAFKEESRRLFQDLGWAVKLGCNGGCDTVTKDRQDLYLHPNSFSGVLEESNIEPLQEHLAQARTFRCYHVDRYKEYQDLSDEEYRAELEAKRDEITGYILEKCRTKRSNLYIVAPVAEDVAAKFEICRLCDKDRHNNIGNQFVAELRGLLDADACAVRLRDIEVKLTELRRERRRLLKNEDVEEVIDALRQTANLIRNGPNRLDSFDEVLFADLVEKIIAETTTRIRFRLYGGIELTEQLREVGR